MLPRQLFNKIDDFQSVRRYDHCFFIALPIIACYCELNCIHKTAPQVRLLIVTDEDGRFIEGGHVDLSNENCRLFKVTIAKSS